MALFSNLAQKSGNIDKDLLKLLFLFDPIALGSWESLLITHWKYSKSLGHKRMLCNICVMATT